MHHPKNVFPAHAGIHGAIGYNQLCGAFDMEEKPVLQGAERNAVNQQADSPVDTRMTAGGRTNHQLANAI